MTATAVPSITYAAPPARHDPAVLVANLAALFAADLPLARQLDQLADDQLPPLVPTKSGHFTIAMPDPSGRDVFLHSRHHPVDEARRLLAAQDADGLSHKVCIALHGSGLGYTVAEVLQRVPREAMVLLFEPSLPLIRRMLEVVDLAKPLRSRRLTLVTRSEKSELFRAIGPRAVLLSMPSARIEHAPSMRLPGATGFHEACKAHLDDLTSYSRTSLNTVVLNGRRTAENITANLDQYARSVASAACGGLTSLRGRFDGKPAIIVSAGPSLRRNKHLLTDLQHHAVIIAVQTTLRPLLDMGVTPDFVTSLDYHEISARFFEGLPSSLSTHLVAEAKATRLVLERHPGPISVVGNDYADSMLRELRPQLPRLPAGATVAHLAFYLAQHLGCDPILFVGQDLGFTDGLCYTPGTAYDAVWAPEVSRFCTLEMKQWEQIVRERPILRRVSDVHGRAMYTEERLFTYLQQFERDFAAASQRVIDCTEGGVLKRGAPPMSLAEAAAKYCTRRLERPPAEVRSSSPPPPILPSLRARAQEAARIEDIARHTLPLLCEIRDHLADQPRVNRAISRIDGFRAEMNRLGPTYDLVTQFTQQSEMKRFEADLALSSAGIDPHEKQRRQVLRDLANCESILAAARVFADFVTTTANEFQRRGVA